MEHEFYVTSTETAYTDTGVEIHLYGRDTDGERHMVAVTDFEPYFYVPVKEAPKLDPKDHDDLESMEPADVPSLFDDNLAKIIASHPGAVPALKDQYDETYEADVVFTNRFRIDNNLYTGIRAPSSRCSVDDIEAAEITDVDVRKCYFDIEIADDSTFPVQDGTVIHTDSEILSLVAYDTDEQLYRGFIFLPDDIERSMPSVVETGDAPGGLDKLHYYDSEEAMLKGFFNFIEITDPDMFLAWNIGFDAAYLVERAKYLGLDAARLARSPDPTANHDGRYGETEITGRVVYDLMEAWEAMQYSEVSTSLNNAASMELDGDTKIEHEESILEMWHDDTAGLMEYNSKDVELMVEINDSAGVMQDRRELKEAVGADWEYTIEANDFIEMLVRRKLDEWGAAAPTKTPPSGDDGFEGAYTFPAFEGIERNVSAIDLASLYPFTMWMLNSSPETYVGQADEIDVDSRDVTHAPNGACFSKDETGLFKELVDEALELTQQAGERRDSFDPDTEEWEYWNQVREARKRIRNALYGVLGWVWFFLYHEKTAEAVTTMAQEVIKTSADYIDGETQGKVVYGDTDSCYISWPDEWTTEEVLNATQDVVDELNEKVYPELASEWGMEDVENKWEIELEDVSERMFQADKKKRYAKKVVWKEGMDFSDTLDEPEISIKGFEYKRSDTASLTASVQKKVLTYIVNGADDAEIREAVYEGSKQISRRYPDWNLIGIPGGIGKSLDNYDSDTAQVRAAKTANNLLGMDLGEGDKPMRVYLEEKSLDTETDSMQTDVIAYNDATDLASVEDQLYVDVSRMQDVLIKGPIGRIVESVGIDVDSAMKGQIQQSIGDWV